MRQTIGKSSRKGWRGGSCFLAGILLALMLFLTPEAFAQEIDPTRTDGSVTLILQVRDKATGEIHRLEDGTVFLYKVSEVVKDEKGQYAFDIASGVFKEAEGMENLTGRLAAESSSIAAKLARLTAGKRKKTGQVADGSVTIKDLTPGLYLIMQDEEEANALVFDPFLFTIPYDDEYQVSFGGPYEVQAQPKLELTPEQTPTESGNVTTAEVTTPPPTESGNVTTAYTPSGTGTPRPTLPPSGGGGTPPRLPQTGQLWWPVPLLFLAGFFLAMTGLIVRIRA